MGKKRGIQRGMWLNKKKKECVLIALMAIVIGIIFLWNNKVTSQYEHFNNQDITYIKGIVTEVSNDELLVDQTDPDRYLGLQKVKAKILSGKYKGEIYDIENYLTASNNIVVEKGTQIIISQDEPEGAEPYFLVYNYHRSTMIYGIVVFFFILMILIGGYKGVRAIIGLVFTLFVIVMWMIPMIYRGNSPIITALITVVMTTAVTLILLNGFSKKTLAAVVGTALGVLLVGVIFAVCSAGLHISGYNVDETEFMVLIAKNTKLKVSEVLFAGVLIASLGAVMDIGMSIASAVYEIQEANRSLSVRQLFFSGLNVGKDMIGTMSNTLILAFTGGGLSTLLVLTSYGIKYHQFVSSDYLAIEVGRGLSGTMAVILTVPITSLIAALIYKRRQ